ncbi:UNVERIFIED_CONTAM: hypothetical protein GTU68_065791 [Idotea baltica]|nr:hypothetical protein [Idotea baltica]
MDRPIELHPKLTYILVGDTHEVAGQLAANFYDHPSRKLKLVGVTGTNGKTSIVQLSHRLFSALDIKTGMLSTIENKIGNVVLPSSLTTPDAITLQRLLAKMVEEHCQCAFMEVSSHALDQGRVLGVTFSVAVFSNITHDHLDYHGTFDHYIKAKKQLFDSLGKESQALINIDDRRAMVMTQNTKAFVSTYALQKAANFKGRVLDNSSSGLHMFIDGVEVFCHLVGAFNASNLMAVYGIARLIGLEQGEVLKYLSNLRPPSGRMEVVYDKTRDITAFVDYAHTPDALQNVLETISEIKRKGQQVITVVGCGGNRDATKRPMMTEIAARYSDQVILTSDNPRFEDPYEIIKEMQVGIPAHKKHDILSIVNRREAIRIASSMIHQGGIILVAGKGHEDYQEIEGKKHPFDDKLVLRECFDR